MSALVTENAPDFTANAVMGDNSFRKFKLDASGIAEANTLLEQLRAKYGDLGLSVDTVRGRIVALTETQRQFTAAAQIIQAGNDPQKETHLAQLERLKQLAEQEKLTAAEQQEAQTIVNTLNGAYNNLGLGIDTITGKLNLAASAQNKFNEAMKAATLGELDAEIAELEANLKELQAENEALLSCAVSIPSARNASLSPDSGICPACRASFRL